MTKHFGQETRRLNYQINYKRGIANSYHRIGLAYLHKGNYPDALKNYLNCVKLFEELGNKYQLAGSYVSIGIIYWFQHNYKSAEENYRKALKIYKELGNKNGVADSYGNIGLVYFDQAKLLLENRNYKEAEKKYYYAKENYEMVLKIFSELSEASPKDVIHKQSLAGSYNNIANVYSDLDRLSSLTGNKKLTESNYETVIENYFNGLKMFESIGDKQGVAGSYNNIANMFRQLNQNKNSIQYSLNGLSIAKEIVSKDDIQNSHLNLYKSYSSLTQFKEALTNYKLYVIYRDSLLNEENTKKTVQVEMQFEFDKKEAATKLEQEKKEAISAAESKKQKVIIWSVCGILLLVLAFALFAYRSYLQKQKANAETTKQKHLIEEKQKEILDSIYYARRIQRSLLPNEKYIARQLNRYRD